MVSYLINGWDEEIPKKDIQGYLDRGELYDDCWAMALPDDGKGWQMVRDILAADVGVTQFAAGSKVEGLYGDGTWYPGTVQAANGDGSYLITFDGFEGAETCKDVRAAGGGAAAEVATTPTQGASAAASADPKVWHVLGADGSSTNGPFSVADLETQLASAKITSETYMIHETGTDWVTVGSEANTAATQAPAVAPTADITPLVPAPETTSSGNNAKQFAAAQTRKRHHARKKTEVTVFAAMSPAQEKKHERKRSQRLVGSRAKPVKGGTDSYGKKDKNAFDGAAGMQICQWMEIILDREIASNAEDFKTYLMTETQVFCELFNTFKPDSTRKAKKSRMRFKQQENIGHFFRACKGLLDMEDVTLFSANECLDGKNLNSVLHTIVEFAKRMRAEFPPDDAPPALEVTFERRKVGRF